ncbi:LysR family transcriptional regulator [Nocardia sp. 2YAB30]|uniref:helix-turn-helix domain-containing protein n=1 Tax=Nocardia sp. 2YAB30 TaxID=3233022 RepID=UPI003F996EBF
MSRVKTDAREIAQPAVSGQFRRLAQQLGVPLFVRSRQGVRPTVCANDSACRIGPHLDHVRAALVRLLIVFTSFRASRGLSDGGCLR